MTFHAFNEFLQQKNTKIKAEGWNLKENCYKNPSTLNLIHILFSFYTLFVDGHVMDRNEKGGKLIGRRIP